MLTKRVAYRGVAFELGDNALSQGTPSRTRRPGSCGTPKMGWLPLASAKTPSRAP